MNKRTLTLVISLLLVALVAVGGTLAWLTDKTESVENVFTPSTIDVDLTESDNLDLQMVPGADITKDPVATVQPNSEACWLFVKIDKSATYDTYLEPYVVATGWTKLDGQEGVYYRQVGADADPQSFPILKDNKVYVKEGVTKTQMDDLAKHATAEGVKVEDPTLTFTVYAIQQLKFDNAADAWAELAKTAN